MSVPLIPAPSTTFYVPPTRESKEKQISIAREWSIIKVVAISFVILFCITISIGSVLGWVEYFHSDDELPKLAALRVKDAQIQQQIQNEAAARGDADMYLMSLQANLSAVINEEIATRTEEYNLLISLIQMEIMQRIQGQQKLYADIETERNARIAQDTIFDVTLLDLEGRIVNLTHYMAEAAALFLLKEQNITDLRNRLTNETNTRLIQEMILMNQVIDQNSQITTFSIMLDAERTARIAADMSLMMQVNALIGDHILYINDISTVVNSFLISSANSLYEISTSPPITVVIHPSNVLSLSGVQSNPVTSNIRFVAGTNTVISYNGSNVHFMMKTIPIVPTRQAYFGSLSVPFSFPGTIPSFAVQLSNYLGLSWQLDFYPTIATNINTPDNKHWAFPTDPDDPSISIGTWLIKMQIAIGVFPVSPAVFLGMNANFPGPTWGNMEGSICLGNSTEQCAVDKVTRHCNETACSLIPIQTMENKAWNIYESSQFTYQTYGGLVGPQVFPGNTVNLEPFFVVMEINTVVYAWGLPNGTRVYPMWQVQDVDRAQLAATWITSVYMAMDAVRIQ